MEKIQYTTGAKTLETGCTEEGERKFHFVLSQSSTDQCRDHLLSPCFLLRGKVKACVGRCQGHSSFSCPIQNAEVCCATGGQGAAERTVGLLEEIKGILILQPCHRLRQEGRLGATGDTSPADSPIGPQAPKTLHTLPPLTPPPHGWLPGCAPGDSRGIFTGEH